MREGKLSIAPGVWIPVKVVQEADNKGEYVAEARNGDSFIVGRDLWVSMFMETRPRT